MLLISRLTTVNHMYIHHVYYFSLSYAFSVVVQTFRGFVVFYYTPRKQSLGGVYRNHPVRPSVRPCTL